MTTEDYVSFEVAKLLKESGFNEYCRTYYTNYRIGVPEIYNSPQLIDNKSLFEMSLGLSAPTLQMAIKWLRKTHKIFFNVNYYNLDIGNEWLQLRINRLNKIGCEVSFEGFDPEEQYEKAIKYCLENLI